MNLEAWVLAGAAVVLCGISIYILLKDMEKISLPLKIYSAITVMLVIGVALTFHFIYTDNTFIHNLKRICILSIMGPIAYVDLKEQRIPNKFVLLGLIYWAALIPLEYIMGTPMLRYVILSEIIAAAAMFAAAMLCRVCVKGSIGAGDIKLFLVMGLFLGLDGIWSAVLTSLIISFFIAIVLLLRKKKTKKDSMAFGPALAMGTLLSVWLTGM